MAAQQLAAAERELIRDPKVEGGVWLLAPQPGKRVVYGQLPGRVRDAAAVWDLAQWSGKLPLSNPPNPSVSGGALVYSNATKRVAFGPSGTAEADFILGVWGSAEYGTRARQGGEPWVHLLLQQDLVNPPALADLKSARLRVEARLNQSRKIETPDYTPALHAAQFQIFFSVQNLNLKSPGYGKYLWFGVPIYDDRQRFVPAYQAQDTGGTQMYIFTPAAKTFAAQSAHDGEWVEIDRDLLPLMREGLAAAWAAGFLTDSKSLADYRLAGMNLGWEVPGLFDVEMQVRNLSLRVE